MSQQSIEDKHLTVSVKLLIAIIVSTVSIVATVFIGFRDLESKFYDSVRNVENENKIQDLKFENLKLEVERNKITLERMREEIRDGRL